MSIQRLLLFFILSLPLLSQADFWDEHSQGWHWYQAPAFQLPAQPTQKAPDSATTSVSNDPVAHMSALQKAIKEALDAAILNPTPQHVELYMALQSQLTAMAGRFSQVWQYELWQHPTLNYSIAHPTMQIANDLYLDQQQTTQLKAVHQLASQDGLFFFFRSTCPYCHRFAPIVKDFATRYGFQVIPISLDGGTLPEFPDARIDNGIAERLQVAVVPALFAVNPHTQQILPLSYGLTSEEDLLSRIVTLTSTSASSTAQSINPTAIETAGNTQIDDSRSTSSPQLTLPLTSTQMLNLSQMLSKYGVEVSS